MTIPRLSRDFYHGLLGHDVAIDGDTAVLGADYNDHSGQSDAGAGYVFVRSGGTWTQQAKLIASDAATNDIFGNRVTLSGDVIAVGAHHEDHGGGIDVGSAYVFVRSGASWHQYAKLIASDASDNDHFGSVATNGDTVIVASWSNDAGGIDAGTAYVFDLLGTDCNANGTRDECDLLTPPGMASVPTGEYLMGDHFNQGNPNELPVHVVFEDAFCIDLFEVTNQQYADALNWALNAGGLISVTDGVVNRFGGSNPPAYCDTTTSHFQSRITWNGTAFGVIPGKENHPMVKVSWYGAAAYSNWRSAQEGLRMSYDTSTWSCDFSARSYHLPTESEWEKAARGGLFNPYRVYPWGNVISGANANYLGSGDPYESAPETFPGTTPVGYYNGNQIPSGPDMVNGYGLYDMVGNVWEWCNDWYGSEYYGVSPYDNPVGPDSGVARVLRGGSWIVSDVAALRSAYRGWDTNFDLLYYQYGFRLVRDGCSADCNANGIPDECDIADCPPGDLACADCQPNGVPDECDILPWPPIIANPEPLNNNAVSDDGYDAAPKVITDRAGNWVAVWESRDSLGGTIGNDADILVALSSDNGLTWTDPSPLNNNAATDSGDDQSVQLATDGSGNWVAVWGSSESLDPPGADPPIGTDGDILIARSTDNGLTWTDPVPLNNNAAKDAGADWDPTVTTDGVGAWVTVWRSNDTLGGTIGTDEDILVARSTDNGLTWADPEPLNSNAATDIGRDGHARIATDGVGNWVAVWWSEESLSGTIGIDGDILVARITTPALLAGNPWTDPEPLNNADADSGYDNEPEMTTDGSGNWVVVWASDENLDPPGALPPIGTDGDILVARSTNNGLTWTDPQPLNNYAATDSGIDEDPNVSTDGAGKWLAVWMSKGNLGLGTDYDALVALSIDNGQTWTDPRPLNNNALTDVGYDSLPKVTTDGSGNWVATWNSNDSLGGTIGTDGDIFMVRFLFSQDCNHNGIPDECDIRDCPPLDATCLDCNHNQIPDGCEGGPLGICPNDCTGHGFCDCDTCICDAGWSGPDCSLCAAPNCVSDSDCQDADACTIDRCELSTCSCEHVIVPDCCSPDGPCECSLDADCTASGWCCNAASHTCQPPPCLAAANRYLSLSPAVWWTGLFAPPTALRVTSIDLQNPEPPNLPQFPPPDFSAYESATCTAPGETIGCTRWVGKPGTFLESQDSPGLGSFRGARLQCTPDYRDWSVEGVIHVTGAEIVPSSIYHVESVSAACMGQEPTCTAVSTPAQITTTRSGDITERFNPPDSSTQPDALDVAQLVNKLKALPGAPIKAIAQLQPNLPELNADVNALDVVAVVDAVKQKAYAFGGPCPCPSAVTCGSTACPSGPGVCVTAYGAGALCVKTCSGGDNDGNPCINNSHCPGSPGGACGDGFCRDRCGRCSP